MVVIKINDIPAGGPSSIRGRAERSWKRKIATLTKETSAVVMHKGLILEEYQISAVQPDIQSPGRVIFDLIAKPHSTLTGKKVKYPTRNPCTTTTII